KTFGNCLPHPSTLRKWYGVVNGKPGLLAEALKAVKNKKDVHFNGVHNIGYVNMGTKNDESDTLPMASDILVFMLVALNSNWKIPVAYFLINGISAEEKSNLVNKCLSNVYDTGAVVKSLTFDGAASKTYPWLKN
ncbi:THAP-type domain-containing protein, partial [Aphis craccivora]